MSIPVQFICVVLFVIIFGGIESLVGMLFNLLGI